MNKKTLALLSALTVGTFCLGHAHAAESKAYPDGYAAHWQHNNMLFSVSAKNIGRPEFMHLLSGGLIELSKNYF